MVNVTAVVCKPHVYSVPIIYIYIKAVKLYVCREKSSDLGLPDQFQQFGGLGQGAGQQGLDAKDLGGHP